MTSDNIDLTWYEENIEENIRNIVFALRNIGINTTCSCGHEMWIECDSNDPTTEKRNIITQLWMLGFKNFDLTLKIKSDDAHIVEFWLIEIKK